MTRLVDPFYHKEQGEHLYGIKLIKGKIGLDFDLHSVTKIFVPGKYDLFGQKEDGLIVANGQCLLLNLYVG